MANIHADGDVSKKQMQRGNWNTALKKLVEAIHNHNYARAKEMLAIMEESPEFMRQAADGHEAFSQLVDGVREGDVRVMRNALFLYEAFHMEGLAKETGKAPLDIAHEQLVEAVRNGNFAQAQKHVEAIDRLKENGVDPKLNEFVYPAGSLEGFAGGTNLDDALTLVEKGFAERIAQRRGGSEGRDPNTPVHTLVFSDGEVGNPAEVLERAGKTVLDIAHEQLVEDVRSGNFAQTQKRIGVIDRLIANGVDPNHRDSDLGEGGYRKGSVEELAFQGPREDVVSKIKSILRAGPGGREGGDIER